MLGVLSSPASRVAYIIRSSIFTDAPPPPRTPSLLPRTAWPARASAYGGPDARASVRPTRRSDAQARWRRIDIHFVSSSPNSWMQANDCAANASFNSIRSTRSHRARAAGRMDRPQSHERRFAADGGTGRDRHHRREPEIAPTLFLADHEHGRASLIPDALPAVTVPFGSNAVLSVPSVTWSFPGAEVRPA